MEDVSKMVWCPYGSMVHALCHLASRPKYALAPGVKDTGAPGWFSR